MTKINAGAEMKKKNLSLSRLVKSGAVLPDGTVQVKSGIEAEPNLDMSGVTVDNGTPTTVQAAASITLPDGPYTSISGVSQINTIATRDGTETTLIFQDAGCALISGKGNYYSPLGDYVAQKNGVVRMLCQGGTWIEISRSHPILLDVWYYNTSSQAVADDTSTNVQWTDNGYFFFPKDTVGILYDDPADASDTTQPKTAMAFRLPYIGFYDVFWAVTFSSSNPSASAGYRRASLSMFFEDGTPDGTSTDQWAAIGDGNQIPSSYFQAHAYSWTNNITSGGTSSQVDDWNTGSTFASQASTIRNDMYQMARKIGQFATDFTLTSAIPAAGGAGEITIVGACTLYSNGSNLIKLNCSHTQGASLTLSPEAYETFIRISYRGH